MNDKDYRDFMQRMLGLESETIRLQGEVNGLKTRVVQLEQLTPPVDEQLAHVEAHKELGGDVAELRHQLRLKDARIAALESQVVMLNGNAENGAPNVH